MDMFQRSVRNDVRHMWDELRPRLEETAVRQRRILRWGYKYADAPPNLEDLPSICGRPAHGSSLTPEMLRALGREVPKEPDEPDVTGHLDADDFVGFSD